MSASRAAPGVAREPAAAAEGYRRALASLERPGHEPAWLRDLRRQGLERFEAIGFPTARDEDWKYTSVLPIARLPHRRPPAPAAGALDGVAAHFLGGPTSSRLVFVDGRFEPSLSASEPLPPGVRIEPLSRLLRSDPEALRTSLGRVAEARHGTAFVALATALFEDGAAVLLPARTCLPAPIDLLFLRTGSDEPATATSRIVVVAGEGARATILERHVALGAGGSFTNVVTEADLGPGAHLEHVAWQEAADEAFHVSTTQVLQGKDSFFRSHALSFGAALARADLNVVLGAEGAECALDGLYLVDGTRHVDHHTRIDHARPRGTSRETYKGVVADRGHAVFNGRIVVHPDAQKTDARQGNHNLLLSDDAEVDTKPQLEIFADDVKCAHGTTVGQLEADAVFYLRSRGLDLAAATSMLVRAFAREVTDRVEVPLLRSLLEARLEARLPLGPGAAAGRP